MLDKNNLKRIKGILSARQGTEIPKFQNPGRPLNISTISGVQKIIDNVNLTIALQNTLNELNNDPEIWWYRNVERKEISDPITITDNRIPSESSIESSVNKKIEKKVEEKVEDEIEEEVEEEVEKSRKERRQDRIARKEAEWGGKDIRNQGIYDITQGISTGIQSIGNIFGEQQSVTDSQLTRNIDTAYNGVSSAISNMGPAGKVVGMAMDTLGAIGNISQAMGGGTDQQTKLDSWMDSPLLSWNVGAINGFFGKNTDSFGVDQETLQQVGGSYGGITTSINEAAESADKEYGLFSGKARKKANDAINKAKQQQNLMGNIANQASDQRLAVQSMGEQSGLAYSMMTNGGYDQKYTYAAKQGGILEWEPDIKLKWEPQIELNWELPEFKEGGNIDIIEELEWIPEFKSGGKTEKFDIPEIEETNQKNVIPEGALHKNKHHIEHADGLTKKGIPVIDGDGEQQAEIEHSEIIFTLEVTKKLEEYYQIFYSEESSNKEKEQAALDAGKLLVYQILENTEDRTGLIESCKQGGTLNIKESNKNFEKEQIKKAFKEVLLELLNK